MWPAERYLLHDHTVEPFGLGGQVAVLALAVADVAVGGAAVDLTIRLTLEPILTGMDLTGLADTNESPLADSFDALPYDYPANLTPYLTAAWLDLGPRIPINSA